MLSTNRANDDIRVPGINNISTPAPRLYDVSTGARLYLEPHTPSGLTLLAILPEEGGVYEAEDAVGRCAKQSACLMSSYSCL